MTIRTHYSRRLVAIAIAVIAGLIAAAPLWGPGIVNTRGGGDSPFLLQRTVAMAENLSSGVFPARWMAHAAYDLGYPFFSYYAALPYYLSGSLTTLGIDILSSIQATQTAGFILAALAMALLVRRLFRSRAARFLAVVAYTFAPFHLVNVYVRGDSLSEFYAFVWYPLILWALDRLTEKASWGHIVTAALAYGGLILTHNVSALIFSPFALLYGLAVLVVRAPVSGDDSPGPSSWKSRLSAGRLLALATPFILGILLTAWFWLPAIGETGYGQMGSEFTAGYFHYSNHFRSANLVQPSLAFDYSVETELGSTSPFAMGLVQAALAALGSASILAAAYKRSRGSCPAWPPLVAITGIGGLAMATLMITPLSRPLWDHLPLLEMTQFPWRFLSVQALFTALVTGALGEAPLWDALGMHDRHCTIRVGLAATAAMLLVIAGLGGLRPERLRIQPSDVTRENLLLYESFTGNIGTTIRYEYLPQDVVPRLYISEAVVDGVGTAMAEGGLGVDMEAELLVRRPNRQSWRVSLPDGPATVVFPLNWWPGWRMTVDGEPMASGAMPGSGRMAAFVPAGDHTVILSLHPTPLRRMAGWLSALTGLTTALATVLFGRCLSWRATWTQAVRVVSWAAIIITISLVGPWLGQRGSKTGTPGSESEATFFDFNRVPYPHRGPVDFGPAGLSTVAQSSEIARPGDSLRIALYWSRLPATPLTATIALVSPAEPRHDVPYTLGEVTVPVTVDTEVDLDLPQDLARGLYLLSLRVDADKERLAPRTPEGNSMGELYIGALRIPEGPPLPSEAPVIGQYRDLTLHYVDAQQREPGALSVRMAWSTQGTPRNWQLSLRLLDATGRLIVQQDHQPGYGYLPTTLWLPGELVVDLAHLPIPEGQAPGDYTLRIISYLQATGEGGGEQDIPVALTAPTLYDIRDACCEQTRKGATILCQTREMALLSLARPETITEGDDLVMQAEWNALLAPSEDLRARWQVTAPDGTVVAETEQPLAPGSATSVWPRFAWVLAPVTLDLPTQLVAGPYTVDLTFTGRESEIVACGPIADLTVMPRPRDFEPPEPPKRETATFGNTIRLLGYETDLDPEGESVALTVWWQALISPSKDLKRFVHLYDPITEVIVAQDDAMPRDWQYPTSWWASGEIVSETVTLHTTEIKTGVYRLAVGWYDPETVTRLQATLPDGAPAPDNRVTLEEPVMLPLQEPESRRWPWSAP